MYHSPCVKVPTVEELKQIAWKYGLHLPDTDMEQYQGFIVETLKQTQVMNKYSEPKPPVKYPRVPGCRPQPEENIYNAWSFEEAEMKLPEGTPKNKYYKTEIHGASTGPLHGKKVVMKDNIAVAGVPMMNGSKIMEGYTPEFDASVVTRVLDAGACVVGKAACEDLCISGTSFNCSTGPMSNFYDKTRVAGGSSSGCALLVAAGEVDMAIGADQGGSIRVPSSCNGIVGLKPTWGLVPYTGAMSMEATIDFLGPMAASVEDCALLLEVIAGYDNGLDGRQSEHISVPKYSQALDNKTEGMKIGVLQEGFEKTESHIKSVIDRALKALKNRGADVQNVSIPMHKDAAAIYFSMSIEGEYQTMFDYGGMNTGLKGFCATSMVDTFVKGMKSKPNDLSTVSKYIVILGHYLKENYGCHYIMKAKNVLRLLSEKYDEALKKYDVLVIPTINCLPPKLPSEDLNTAGYMEAVQAMLYNCCPFNATGHPAVTVNAGFTDGLPVGMMVIGKHHDDITVLKVAHAVETIQKSSS